MEQQARLLEDEEIMDTEDFRIKVRVFVKEIRARK